VAADADSEDGARALDQVLEALANPHRRQIVYLLGLQPWGISQLAERRGLSLPAIHKHLKILEQAGLLSRRKHGRTTYLTLDSAPLALLQSWVGQFHPYWGGDQGSRASYDNYARHLGFDPDGEQPGPPAPTGAPQ
jgi:DNA-binding transcriptional ArsR family regulator